MEPDDPYYAGRVRKAERLRRSRGRLWAYFCEPDYYGSAEIFEELADGSDSLAQKEMLYGEAARTFLMKKGEYSHFRAAEVYKKLQELFRAEHAAAKRLQELPRAEHAMAKALEYGELYSSRLESTGRLMMAGQAADDLADLCEAAMPQEAIGYRGRAIALYGRDGSCPFHLKKSREKRLMLQLAQCDYAGAREALGVLDVRYARLCRQLLAVVLDMQAEDDLESAEESNVLRILINRSREEGLRALEDFASDNFLPEYAQRVFQAVAARLSPENDIC